MIINTDINSMLLGKIRNSNQQDVTLRISRISTGRKAESSQDASGLSISTKLKAQIGGIQTALNNAEDTMNLLQVANQALSSVSDVLIQMRDTCIRLCNQATLSNTPSSTSEPVSSDSRDLKNELDSLKSQLVNIFDTTQYNGKLLLTGDFAGGLQTTQISPNSGNDQKIAVTLDDLYTIVSTMPATPDIYEPTPGADATEWEAYARKILTDIDETNTTIPAASRIGLPSVQKVMADIGIMQKRLENTISDLNNTYLSLSSSDSRIADADMAEEITEYTKRNIIIQSADSIASQSMSSKNTVAFLIEQNLI